MRIVPLLLAAALLPAAGAMAATGTEAGPALTGPVTGIAPPDRRGTVRAPELVLPWFNGVFQSIGQNVACLSDPPIVEIRYDAGSGGYQSPSSATRRRRASLSTPASALPPRAKV